MKYGTLLLLFTFIIPLSIIGRNQLSMEPETPIQQNLSEDEKTVRWDYLSAGSGVAGLVMAFLPYLSLFGVLLGAAAIVFSVLARRKKQKKGWARLGMITGVLTMVAFLAVVGLIIFF